MKQELEIKESFIIRKDIFTFEEILEKLKEIANGRNNNQKVRRKKMMQILPGFLSLKREYVLLVIRELERRNLIKKVNRFTFEICDQN